MQLTKFFFDRIGVFNVRGAEILRGTEVWVVSVRCVVVRTVTCRQDTDADDTLRGNSTGPFRSCTEIYC